MTLPREFVVLGVFSVVLPTWLITLVYSELDFAVMLDAFPIPLLFLATGQVPIALDIHLGSRHPRATARCRRLTDTVARRGVPTQRVERPATRFPVTGRPNTT